ncbi:MAG: CHASE2 domain-containing protein [Fibrobacterota bacterium]
MARKNKDVPRDGQKGKLLWGGLIFSFAFVALLFFIPAISVHEWRLFDFWMINEYPRSTAEDVAVVGIDEDLFEVMGFNWPISKDTYAEIILMLQEYGAEVMAFDVLFLDKICNEDDFLFAEYLRQTPNISLGMGFVMKRTNGGRGVIHAADDTLLDTFALGPGNIYYDKHSIRRVQRPYDKLCRYAHSAGFVNRSITMPDGVDRKMPLLLSANSRVYPSLALDAVSLFRQDSLSYDLDARKLMTGGDTVSMNDHYGITVNFRDSIPFFNLSTLYREYNSYLTGEREELAQHLAGKTVFIGSSSETVGDMGLTPISSKYSGGRAPIVTLHAMTAHTILQNIPVKDLTGIFSLGLSFAMLLVLYGVFSALPKKFLFFVIPALFITLYVAGLVLFHRDIFLPLGQSFMAMALFTVIGIIVDYLEDNREYRYLTSLFKTYLSPQYIEDMARTHTVPRLGGEAVYGTAFFTDIEHFSTFSERFSPEDLIAVLNTYFSRMTNLLLENQGTLDRYSGDAIIAFFGAPKSLDNSARYACKTACEMQHAVRELEKLWHDDPSLSAKITTMNTRIGINTGEFVTGNIGCDIRMNYTMIGDSVNLAARLESAAKQYGVYILVGEQTREDAGDDFLFREIDKIIVVGKHTRVRIYELLGRREDETSRMRGLIAAYEQALQQYYAGHFAKGEELFRGCIGKEPDPDKNCSPSRVMARRCEMLRADPPPEWTGVFSMTRK